MLDTIPPDAAARRHLRRALALNPNDADVLAHASFGMALIGEHEVAVELGRRPCDCSPITPTGTPGSSGSRCSPPGATTRRSR